MIYPSINDLVKHAGSRYALVIATAKRARELSEGKENLINEKSNKCVSVAINEIDQNKINIIKGEERDMNSELFRKLGKTGVILDDETTTMYADDDEEEEYDETIYSISDDDDSEEAVDISPILSIDPEPIDDEY